MRLRAAVLTALAGAALAVPATPAAAAACTQGSGVTVVVDFAALGGGTQTQCASGNPSSGLAALRGAGFTPTRAAQEPGYFVCRINGKPANDPCQRTSPADAYWSYWHAKPGGSWTYSAAGPADYDPEPGTVDGWAFGAGKQPSSPPPRAAQPSPSPAARPTHAATAAAPKVVARAATTPTPPTSAPTVTAASPTPAVAVASRPASASASPPSDPNSVTKVAVERTYAVPYSVLAGLLVLLLLLAAAARQIIRRRRESRG